MNNLRKRPTFNDLINYLNNQPIIKYPERKGINMINNMIISNLLFNDEIINDKLITAEENIIKSDKFTQTLINKQSQTNILDQETQKPYELQHYDLYPHLYYKIDATSKYMKHNKDIKNKNNAFAGIISTNNKKLYDSIIQTSSYIPSSLKEKSDNINQTVRFMLKQIKPQDESEGDYDDWYKSLRKKDPSRESLPPINDPDPPEEPPISIASPPSIPSASIPSSPSESPPPSDIELTQQQIRERSRSRDSIKSDKDKLKK